MLTIVILTFKSTCEPMVPGPFHFSKTHKFWRFFEKIILCSFLHIKASVYKYNDVSLILFPFSPQRLVIWRTFGWNFKRIQELDSVKKRCQTSDAEISYSFYSNPVHVIYQWKAQTIGYTMDWVPSKMRNRPSGGGKKYIDNLLLADLRER